MKYIKIFENFEDTENESSFFYDGEMRENSTISLDTNIAKHIYQVLRLNSGDKIVLIDGKGTIAKATINTVDRHRCDATIDEIEFHPKEDKTLHLCAAFTKNNVRNEWLLEKTTELGVGSITPIITTNSEKVHVRDERWLQVLKSAVIQSEQFYLPELTDMISLESALEMYKNIPQKFVAYSKNDEDRQPFSRILKLEDTVLLIGPDGDFTPAEINLCKEHGFVVVSLSKQRLRTETAAVLACSAWHNKIG